MGGFFGAISHKNCIYDVFFGTDYHSHLGTRRAGLAFYDCLHTHYIGFPGSVGTSVRVRNLNPKRYAFSAEITFCHNTAPPLGSHNDIILADFREKSKGFFKENWEVVKKP